MSVSIFLSHTAADKEFVRRLARDLDSHGVKYWLDEAEIKVGESLSKKIRTAIDEVDYVAVILSPDSIASSWVQHEIDVAMTQEINGKRVKVLPIMYKHCQPPGFLLGKLYADFTDESKYAVAFKRLVESIGVVFNKRALDASSSKSSLDVAINKALALNLPLFRTPFHRPFQYIGLSVPEAAKAVGHAPNEAGNIVIDTEDCHMLLQAEGNFITFVEVELKRTAPWYRHQEFDSESLLGAFSINPAELDLISKQTYCDVYYDHRKKLKVSVACLYDEGPLSIGFGTKYYGM